MYNGNTSELIKRLWIVVMILMIMIMNINVNSESIGKVLQMFNYSSNITSSYIINQISTSNQPSVTQLLSNINPFIKVINHINIEEEPSSLLPAIEQTEELVIEQIDVQETIIEESIDIAPVTVQVIEETISCETDITDVYNFSAVPLSDDLMKVIIECCEKFGIPIPIALGLIDVESDFNTTAGSQTGCYGLMQLNHIYFDVYSEPSQQIHDGLEYLSNNLECYGDIMIALNVYNAGHVTGNMNYSNAVMKDATKWAEVTGAPMI